METAMSEQRFSSGDRVRHGSKPEWGIGTVIKAEIAHDLPSNGHAPQRLTVRFPNAGLKTLVTSYAELTHVNGNDLHATEHTEIARYWDQMSESDWLGPMAKKKIEQAMMSLPQDVRDPFNSVVKRLSLTLGLYRFNRSGRGLIDWAVAQTGLDDPLSRFTRQELEQRFDRWAFERENHLVKLLQEARAPGNDQSAIAATIKAAPPEAHEVVRRLTASR